MVHLEAVAVNVPFRNQGLQQLHDALQFSGQNVFRAMNKRRQALFFSIFRKVILVVPLTLLLPAGGILFLLILAGICAVGGLICGRRFGQGVLAGVMGLMLGQILMDLWIQIPVLRSGFMKPLYTSLTGLMNTIGSRFGMAAEFAPYTGVGGVILLIILMIIRLVILFYAVSMKQLYNFQTLLAFLVALVLQGVLYAPIYYLQSQFIWLALGLMVVFGAVLIFVGTGSGLFNMVIEGVGGSTSRKMEASDEWEIEEPQRSDLVYGSDGTQYTTGKDPFGHLVVFDDDNRQHLATERSDGSIIDDEDNEYW